MDLAELLIGGYTVTRVGYHGFRIDPDPLLGYDSVGWPHQPPRLPHYVEVIPAQGVRLDGHWVEDEELDGFAGIMDWPYAFKVGDSHHYDKED